MLWHFYLLNFRNQEYASTIIRPGRFGRVTGFFVFHISFSPIFSLCVNNFLTQPNLSKATEKLWRKPSRHKSDQVWINVINILDEANTYIDTTHLETNSTWHISQLFYSKFKYQQKAINQNIQLFMKLYFFLYIKIYMRYLLILYLNIDKFEIRDENN